MSARKTAPISDGRTRGPAPRPDLDRPLAHLERALSKAGLASRTEARRLIEGGEVTVNGAEVRDPWRWVDLERDRIAVEGTPLRPAERVYLLLYKPKGYVTTRRDPRGRKTVFDLLPGERRYLFTVGRLDLDTSGLLLVTNDSAFADAVANPEHEVPKTYLVKAASHLDNDALLRLRRGVDLKDGPTRPAEVVRLREAGGKTVFEITLREGRNRQVRRMVEAVGSRVLKLVRVAIGGVRIGELKIGEVRELTVEEVRTLRSEAPHSTR